MKLGLSLTIRSFPGILPGARATALASVLALATGLGCVEQADDKPTEEDMTVIKKNLLTEAPKPQFKVDGDIDGKVTYLGLDVSMNPIEPGKEVKLTHYWKVVSAPGAGWRLFTHLNGPSNTQFINVDHGPVNGKYPVSQWKDGQIIRDEHTIRLPPTWPHDKLFIYTGLWRTGNERMPIKSGPKDEGGRLLAGTIPVTKLAAPAVAAGGKRYVARKVAKAIKLDGVLDEAAWKEAPSTGLFVNTQSGAPADHKTEAKLLWDASNLYIAFENADSDVWSTLSKRDDKLWTQEMVEIMIDADKNGKTYVEFQVAPTGNVFDTYLPSWRKYENDVDPKRKPYDWNSKIKAAVKVNGTLNQRKDQDKGWVAEIAIPLADVAGLDTAQKPAPKVGDSWRLNMFRMDSPEGKPQVASAWSPPLVGDFHKLDRFGEVVFGDEKGAAGAALTSPAAAAAAAGGAAAAAAAARQAHGGMGASALPGLRAGKAQSAARKKRAPKENGK